MRLPTGWQRYTLHVPSLSGPHLHELFPPALLSLYPFWFAAARQPRCGVIAFHRIAPNHPQPVAPVSPPDRPGPSYCTPSPFKSPGTTRWAAPRGRRGREKRKHSAWAGARQGHARQPSSLYGRSPVNSGTPSTLTPSSLLPPLTTGRPGLSMWPVHRSSTSNKDKPFGTLYCCLGTWVFVLVGKGSSQEFSSRLLLRTHHGDQQTIFQTHTAHSTHRHGCEGW